MVPKPLTSQTARLWSGGSEDCKETSLPDRGQEEEENSEKIFVHCCTIERILRRELRNTEWATVEFASAWPEVFIR